MKGEYKMYLDENMEKKLHGFAMYKSEKIASDEAPIISGLYIHREEIGPYPPKKLKMTLEHI